jgi:hypothetical protein
MHNTFTLSAALFLSLLLITANAAETPDGLAKATFAVHCYDVGANALAGKPGVASVTRGWSGPREIDRVTYDPQVVTLEQLVEWLKEADTYIGTLQAEEARMSSGHSPE